MNNANGDRSALMGNFFSLSAVQLANYLIPLITIPYLMRTIGTERFGLFSLSAAFAAYFQVLLDYGFNLTATRDISQNRFDGPTLSRIVSGVMSAKLFLLFLSIPLAVAAIFFIPRLSHDSSVYCWAILAAIGGGFLPFWFFQGLEKMGVLAALILGSRVLGLLLIFVFIRKPEDFMTLLYINAACAMVAAAVGLFLMARRVRLGLSFGAAAKVLRSGFGIFTSQVWAAVLASSNVFVLGLFASNKQVGTYAVAEKIVKAAICMGIPLCSSVYPRSGILFRQAADAAYVFLRKFLALGGMIMAAVSVLLFALAPVVVFVVVGRMAPDIAVLVRILAVLPLSVFIDNIYGSQVLLNTGHEKKVVYAVAISALSAIISLVSLVPLLGPLGAAYSYLFSELLVLALMGVFLWRAGVSPLLRVRQAKHGDG